MNVDQNIWKREWFTKERGRGNYYEAAHQRDGCSGRICGDADRMYSGGDSDSGGAGTGISDLFWIFDKPWIFGDRYFEHVMEGNQDGEEHSAYLPFDWDADGTLEGGRDDPGDRILLCRAYESCGYDPDGISVKCSGVGPDRNCIWYSSDHGRDLHDDGKGNGMQRDPCRRSDPFRSLFWRPQFSGFDERSSGGRADAYEYL